MRRTAGGRVAATVVALLATATSAAAARSARLPPEPPHSERTPPRASVPARSATPQAALPCAFSEADAAWLQAALDGWETAARDLLELDPEPLPWIVLIGTECSWNLLPEGDVLSGYAAVEAPLRFAGRPVSLQAREHDGTVRLPSGAEVPARGMAFASLFNRGNTPFFVLALPDVFRLDPAAAADPNLERIILGVVSHEIVHTRQLVAVGRRIEALQGRYELPDDLNDDVIEETFGDDPEFRGGFELEREFLYRAVRGEGDERLWALSNALAVIRERRALYYADGNEPWAEIEDLFLNMEGLAEWAKVKLELADPDGRSLTELLTDAEGDRNTWSQSEGLALCLLLEDLLPGWQQRMLPPELASPVALLEELLQTGAGG